MKGLEKTRFMFTTIIVGACLTGSALAAGTIKAQADESYALGVSLARSIQAQHFDLDFKSFQAGLKDAYQNAPLKYSDVKMKKILAGFQKKQLKEAVSEQVAKVEKNTAMADDFFTQNKKVKGVVTLPNGLQYKIIKAGSGPQPKTTDRVKVNYEGQLLNGKVFDSSYKRGQPITLGLNQVIQGWQQLIPKMHTGATWMLYIPAKFAYGQRGVPGAIPPSAALSFKVNLISIEK